MELQEDSIPTKEAGEYDPPLDAIKTSFNPAAYDKAMSQESELPTEETKDERPLRVRIIDKNWKTRATAYDDLKSLLQSDPDNTSIYSEYIEFLDKMTSDSNASALDSGLDSAIIFADLAPIGFMKNSIDKLTANVVDKAFGARPSTQIKGKALILKLIEIDEPTTITQYLLTKLSDKKPKIPPLCLEILKEGFIAFGARPFPIKEILASLPIVFNGSNGPARDMAMSVIVELSKWIGLSPFHNLLESIKPIQKTEFEKLVAERDAGGPQVLLPTIWIRSQRPLPGTDQAAGVLAKSSILDSRDFIEEIDLNKKLKNTEYNTLINDEKWSEQHKALTMIIDILGPTPKMKIGCDISEYINVCKGFLRQGHVQLQINSLKIIGLFCNGLRTEFSTYARNLTEMVISKAKEKRLITEVQNTLLNMIKYCITYDSFSTEIIENMNNKKNPAHTRICLMEITQQGLIETTEKFSNECMKPLAEVMTSSYEDSDPKVRDIAAIVLSTIYTIVKKRGKSGQDTVKYITSLEAISPKLYKKIQSTATTTTTTSSDTTNSTAPVSSASTGVVSKGSLNMTERTLDSDTKSTSSSSLSTTLKSSTKTSTLKSKTGLGSTMTGSNTSSSSSSSTVGGASTAGGVGGKKSAASVKESADDDNIDDLTMSPEDAEQLLSQLNIPGWESTFQANMMSAKWQDKVDAITLLGKTISDNEVGGQYSAALVIYLSAKTNGFKITNVNILKAVIKTAGDCALHVGNMKFNTSAAWELIKNFGDKYSDKKTKDLVDDLLNALSQALKPSFVIKRMKVIMEKTKSPVAHQYYLEWLKAIVTEYSITSFPLPLIVSLCHLEMENKIAAVRTAAVEVLGAIFHQLGPRFQTLAITDELKPQMISLIEAEFNKVGYDPSLAASKASASGESGVASVIPRQDLSALVDKNIINELNFADGKTSWTNRKTAMESIIAACERSGHYLDGNKNTLEIIKNLKGRMNDTQANLKPIAASAIAHCISSLDPTIGHKLLRLLAEALLSGVSDNKKTMRDSTITSLQLLVTLNKPEDPAPGDPLLLSVLLNPIGELLNGTPVGRQELLQWFLPYIDILKVEYNCTELTNPLITCLQDKIAIVRSLAEQCLIALLTKNLITKLSVDKGVRDLPPATKRSLQPIIDKLMSLQSLTPSNINTAAAGGVKKGFDHDNSNEAVDTITGTISRDNSDMNSSGNLSKTMKSSAVSKSSVPGTTQGKTIPTTSANINSNDTRGITTSTSIDMTDMTGVNDTTTSQWAFKKNTTKSRRLDDFYRVNWPQPPEEPSDNEWSNLKVSWEPYLTSEFSSALFPESKYGPLNQDNIATVMNDLCTQLDSPPSLWLCHTDFLLRYLTCCLCLRETSGGMIKVLQAILLLCLHMKQENYILHESESMTIIPHVIEKCGHKSDRHRSLFKQVLSTLTDVMSPSKMTTFLLQGLLSKNKKSRVVVLEEIIHVIEAHGLTALGKAGIRELSIYLQKETDAGARSVCLDVCYTVYLALGNDAAKLIKLMGDTLTDRTTSMIEDRIKQKSRENTTAGSSLSTTSTMAAAAATTTTNIPTPTKGLPSFPPNTTGGSTKTARSQISTNTTTTTVPTLMMKPTTSETISTYPLTGNNKASSSTNNITTTDTTTHSTTSNGDSGKLPGLYGDIAEKMDALLSLQCKESVDETVRSQCIEETRDYIKILHAMICGEWSAEKSADDDVLLMRCSDVIADKMINFHFMEFIMTTSPKSTATATVGSFNNKEQSMHIDISLVAVILATLFALIKRSELLNTFSPNTIADIYRISLMAIVDKRLAVDVAADEETTNVIKQMLKGLNTIVLRLATDIPTNTSLGVLIPLLSKCYRISIGSHDKGKEDILYEHVANPLSRLIRRILFLESQKDNSYRHANSNTHRILEVCHQYYTQITPSISLSAELNDINSATIKTIILEIVKAIGPTVVLTMLQSMNIPATAIIYKIVHQYIATEEAVIHEKQKQDYQIKIHEMQLQITYLIQEITTVRDKMIPIKQIYIIRKQYPEVDIQTPLMTISSVFRRFVQDTLNKLDKSDEIQEHEIKQTMATIESNVLTARGGNSTNTAREGNMLSTSTTTTSGMTARAMPTTPNMTSFSPTNSSSSNSNNNNGQLLMSATTTTTNMTSTTTSHESGHEAIRILENLINKPPPQTNTTHHRPASPLINNSILNSVMKDSTNNTNNNTVLTPSTSTIQRLVPSTAKRSTTPRSVINDRIRASLSNLTNTLELSGIKSLSNDINDNNSTTNPENTGNDDEADFVSRLSKLRNMYSTFDK